MDGVELTRVTGAEVDGTTAAAIAAVNNAANAVDAPHLPAVSGEHEQKRLVHGFELIPMDAVVLAHDDGELLGFAEVELPRWDNTHVGFVSVQTRPDRRGEGIGDKLLETTRESVDAAGRTLLMAAAWADTHRERFWLRQGLAVAFREAQRRLVTADLDWPHLDALHAKSLEASADYELIDVPMPTPVDMLEGMVRLQQVMNDAPIGDLAIEDENWTAPRLRDIEEAARLRGHRAHRLVARRCSDGELAGHTVVVVEEERPHLGFQDDTEVVPSHRGHKLGLRLKIEMLRRLREREPQVVQIDTWNAESNAHMIAVNDQLGCFVSGRTVTLQKQLAPA